MTRKNKFLVFIMMFFLFLNIFLLFINLWIYNNFGNVKIQEILFTLLSSTSGTDTSFIYSFILKALIPALFIIVISFCFLLFLHKKLNGKILKLLKISCSIFVVSTLLLNVFYTNSRYDIINYLNYKNQKTTIYNKKKAKTKKHLNILATVLSFTKIHRIYRLLLKAQIILSIFI